MKGPRGAKPITVVAFPRGLARRVGGHPILGEALRKGSCGLASA